MSEMLCRSNFLRSVSHPWYSPASLPDGSGCWIRMIRTRVLGLQASHLLLIGTNWGYGTVLTAACALQGCSASGLVCVRVCVCMRVSQFLERKMLIGLAQVFYILLSVCLAPVCLCIEATFYSFRNRFLENSEYASHFLKVYCMSESFLHFVSVFLVSATHLTCHIDVQLNLYRLSQKSFPIRNEKIVM
jgi:hypothetical protein